MFDIITVVEFRVVIQSCLVVVAAIVMMMVASQAIWY